MMVHDLSARFRALTALALLLAGCTVGPDFVRPAAPNVPRYTQTALSPTASAAHVAGGETQRFVDRQDIPGEWWTLFAWSRKIFS